MFINAQQSNPWLGRVVNRNEISTDQGCRQNEHEGHHPGHPFYVRDGEQCRHSRHRRAIPCIQSTNVGALQPGQSSYLDQLEQGAGKSQNSEARLAKLGFKKHTGTVHLAANSSFNPPGTTYWTGPKGEAVRIMADGSVKPEWGDPKPAGQNIGLGATA